MQLEKNSIVFMFGQSFLVPELRIRTEIHKQQWKRLWSGELVKADIREIHHDFYAYLLLCVHTPNTAGILNEERKMGYQKEKLFNIYFFVPVSPHLLL